MKAIIVLVIAMAVCANCRYHKITGTRNNLDYLDSRGIVHDHMNIDDFADVVGRGIVTRRGRGGLKVGSYDRRRVVTDQVNIHALDDAVNRGIETRRGRGGLRSVVDRRGIVHDQVDIDASDDLASRGIVTRKGKKENSKSKKNLS